MKVINCPICTHQIPLLRWKPEIIWETRNVRNDQDLTPNLHIRCPRCRYRMNFNQMTLERLRGKFE
jgi:DNA-directed RNA polymerase subunit RPC12/RpoP